MVWEIKKSVVEIKDVDKPSKEKAKLEKRQLKKKEELREKQKQKNLATREIRGKVEVNDVMENQGKESFKMGESDSSKSYNKARVKTAQRI